MKSCVFIGGLMLFALFSSCTETVEGDRIYDYAPLYFDVCVKDASGEDMLDSMAANYNRQFVDSTTVTYRGKTYPMNYRMKYHQAESRAYYSPFWGINIVKLDSTRYAAEIGPIMRDEDYDNERIQIRWGDGSRDSITFTSHFIGGGFKDIKYLYNNTDFSTESPTAVISITK